MRDVLRVRGVLKGVATTLLAVCLPMVIGCGSGKFFVPTCQETNSCGGGGGGTYSSYAYVANFALGTLTGIPLPTATFSSLSGTSYNLGTAANALAATPAGTFLYVATAAGSIFVYSIGTNGALALGNNGNPVASTLTPTWMTVDPSGNWLFLISSNISALLEYQINPSTGVLTQVGQSTGITLNSGSPTQVYVTPNDQNVYVGLGLGGMDTFAFNSSSGALSNHLHYSPRGVSSDNSIAADNNSAFLFVGEAGQGIRVFTIGAGGALTEISGSPFQSQLGPASIVVDPTNSYVYVANRTANVITGYTLASTGALTPLPSSPFVTGSAPSVMSLDSTGQYLLVICYGGSPDLQVFSFDTSVGGQLDSVTTGSTGTDPAEPISLVVVP